jgi:hypothetical protein
MRLAARVVLGCILGLAGVGSASAAPASPVAPLGPSTLSGGSLQGGVTDNTGDGATLYTDVGSAFCQGHNVPNAAFGTPIPSLASPAVATSIGIELDFWLTPGDSASFTSNFVVVPILEPGTAALFVLGRVALGLRRRR